MYDKEIDELLLPQGKASSLLTDHLITGKVVQVKPSIHIRLTGLVGWFYLNHFIKLKTAKLTAFSCFSIVTVSMLGRREKIILWR